MIACVVVPYFAAALEQKAQATDAPIIVIEYRGSRGKVIAMSEAAQMMGVERGISLSRARALCPQAQLLTARPEHYAEARDFLLNVLWDFTNRIEIDEAAYPHTAVCSLDLGNLKAADLAYLGSLITRALHERMAVQAAVGISRSKFASLIAALTTATGSVTLVPHSDEAAFIAPHPVDLLPLDKNQARRLHILGIRSLGDLAALPRASVLAQFGRSGGALHQLASGMDGRPVKPQRMPEKEAVRRQFEPLSDRTRLEVRVHGLAEALAEKLAARVSALHQLAVTVQVERGKPISQEMHLFEPVTSGRAIAEETLKLLDRMKLTQAVTEIEICASHLVPSMPRQLELFSASPLRQRIIDVTQALAAKYPQVTFYQMQPAEQTSLLPERRFRLNRIDAS